MATRKPHPHPPPILPLHSEHIFGALNSNGYSFPLKTIRKLNLVTVGHVLIRFFSSLPDCRQWTHRCSCAPANPKKSLPESKQSLFLPEVLESRPNVGQFPRSQYNPRWRRLLHRGVRGNNPTWLTKWEKDGTAKDGRRGKGSASDGRPDKVAAAHIM